MTGTQTDDPLAAVDAMQARLTAAVEERERLIAERADLFLTLSEQGFTQAQIADRTALSMQAVGQNIARARTRREAGNMAGLKGGSRVTVPTEVICEDCMDGDHRTCREAGGYMHEDTPERCGCHLTDHALDNRVRPSQPPSWVDTGTKGD